MGYSDILTSYSRLMMPEIRLHIFVNEIIIIIIIVWMWCYRINYKLLPCLVYFVPSVYLGGEQL